jgi:CheY-like chemotaxis protein
MSECERLAATSRFEGVRILLVEDETVLSLLIEDMLKGLGCASIWHASGVSQAIAILRDHQPDAAVLDVNLAGEPGYPIAEQLESAHIPFLFATGYGRHGLPKQWASKPAIQKPFRYDALATALGSLLGR